MILLIGLGNPGSEYSGTRHNIGQEIIDLAREKWRATPWKKRFDALFSEVNINNTNVLLVKPLPFMNLSGVAAKKFVDYYNLQPSDVLIVSDDLSLPVGTVRLKRRTGSGGHNGLKSIQNALGAEINVIKIGVGHPGTKDDVIRHV
ncbi:peptidyl-tRNA hydrolase, partial [Rhizobium sp. PDO1-076]|uniref:aminoacyl-tRNA hydrolase n=1 Tax=Rhizobium sp. PDO1-076 TaxID=1125979 RepID=UPI00024E2B55